MTMALLFWSFRLSEDPKRPINIDGFEDAVFSHADPFHVDFKPRRDIAEISRELQVLTERVSAK